MVRAIQSQCIRARECTGCHSGQRAIHPRQRPPITKLVEKCHDMIPALRRCLDRIHYQVGSENKFTVRDPNPGGIAVMQVQTSPTSSISTSQAWQEPIRHPVGMSMPALAATVKKDSPTSASTSTSSGKKRITTLTGSVHRFSSILTNVVPKTSVRSIRRFPASGTSSA